MHVWHLTKLFCRLFVLRAKPYELPYSNTLNIFLIVMFIALKAISYLWFIDIINVYDKRTEISLNLHGALFVSAVWVLMLFAVIRSTFTYYNILERSTQVISAVLAMDCLLTLMYLVWLAVLSMVELPLFSGSFASAGIIFGFVFMLYWQFMIYIHILVTSMEISILKAGVFALFYMMLQHNLAELLLNLVITLN
jgi:hypothetical protein